jgi:hypothetical protein
MAGGEVKKGRRNPMYLCPVPGTNCHGTVGGSKTEKVKYHSSPDLVRLCETQYLISQGYKKISSREFISPTSGAIMVLSKKAARAKPGKGAFYMAGKHGQKIQVW